MPFLGEREAFSRGDPDARGGQPVRAIATETCRDRSVLNRAVSRLEDARRFLAYATNSSGCPSYPPV